MTMLRQGLVALLGDSAHAMQPNLGQGGCMAIEDGYQLATDLAAAVQDAQGRNARLDMERVLQNYQVRCAAAVHVCAKEPRCGAVLACLWWHAVRVCGRQRCFW
jgi:zeaxanthin epoxidase